MLRKAINNKKEESTDRIKWRGHEVTRIEAFSDAVFAFAVTLLIVSLEVPKNFDELLNSMKGFVPFAFSFACIFQVWMDQNLFFRRFGMHDDTTLRLNGMLLFMILFYVYPLKYMFTSMYSGTLAFNDIQHAQYMYYIYGGAFGAIYLLIAILYHHAYRRRDHLKLTDSEAFEVRTYCYRHMGLAVVGLISVILAMLGGQFVFIAWLPFPFIGLVIGMTHKRRDKKHKKLFAEEYVTEPKGEVIVKTE